ncbi:MAG: hypothetical protein Q9184_001281 [Pyrenodesmia sp. 2 TL-2023]
MAPDRISQAQQGFLLLLPLLLWLLALPTIATPVIGVIPAVLPKLPSLGDCRSRITVPDKDKSLYFTALKPGREEPNKAKAYGESHGLTHVSRVYPQHFTEINRYSGSAKEKRQFQMDFSQVYAERTSGIAYLMLDDGKNAAPESIFYSIEFEKMKHGGRVDKILRIPFTNPPDDPTKSNEEYWVKPSDAPDYATGRCGVHVTHYQIPKGDDKYYLEAKISDDYAIEIGHLEKTDATEPVDVTSALPHVLVITAAKPGSSEDPDGAPLQFAYAGKTWTSDSTDCKFGGYEDGNREGDCGFSC